MNELMKYYSIPANIEEQKTIANILSSIDKEIELLKKEVELFKTTKKRPYAITFNRKNPSKGIMPLLLSHF